MSAAGKPAAFSRAAIASAALVTLPAGVSVVLISIELLVDLPRARIVRRRFAPAAAIVDDTHSNQRQMFDDGHDRRSFVSSVSPSCASVGSPDILRLMKFAPEYVTYVLNENFEDAKALFLSPLMAIHYAHLVMLAEQGIVSRADAHAIRAGARRHLAGRRPRRRLRRHLRGSVLLRRAPDRRRRAARTSPAGCTPRAAATTST